jgi:hypothetical protein
VTEGRGRPARLPCASAVDPHVRRQLLSVELVREGLSINRRGTPKRAAISVRGVPSWSIATTALSALLRSPLLGRTVVHHGGLLLRRDLDVIE